MARKKKKPRRTSVARPDWAQFCTAWHGKGAHRDKSKYTRKTKHKGQGNEH